MARTLIGACVTLCGCLAAACGGGSPVAPASAPTAPAPAASVNVTGNWSGSGADSQGTTVVTWALTQSGTNVSGTVQTRAVNPADGSCNSCHRNKSGTVTGTNAGTTLTLTMVFAAGVDGDPTPACSATLTGTASAVDVNQVAGTYSGSDTCEGAFANGKLSMTRQ